MSNGQITRQIKGEIYDSLRSALVAPQGKTKKSWTDVFIQKMLEEAKQNPAGPLGQLLSKQLLQDDILSNLDAQTERLLARDQDFLRYRIYKQCYKEQRDVLLDETSKWILVNAGRRTGKTNLVARWLVKKCATPNSPCFYIHLKFDSAISQLFELCIESANMAELRIESSSKNEGRILFTNGSSITFKGNSNKTEADKQLRGYKARGIVIDEAAFQINMKYLVEDVLTPTMADFSDSQMVLISTPPRIPHTYYESCYRSGKWTVYEWNARKNPFIPSFDDFVKEVCETKGIDVTSTFIQRELEGKFIYDTEAMVYRDYKTYTQLPENFIPTDIAIGCDYGFQDYNAIAALAYNRNTRQAYVIWQSKFNKSTVTEIVARCREAYEYCKKLAITNPSFDLSHIRFFCDTNEQSISFEMKTNYKLPVYNCYKHDKKMAISQLSDWLRTGTILVKPDTPLTDEFDRIVYKRDEDDTITAEIDDDLFHPDIADALLYASRQYAFDCGYEKKQVEKKQSDRAATLPKWIGDEYDNQ